jgi:putative transposase
MRVGRPRSFEIKLSDSERKTLESHARSRALSHALVRRAEVILASAAGESNSSISARFGLSVPMVTHWRRRFVKLGIQGLYDLPKAGRPRTHSDDEVAEMLKTVLNSAPTGSTQWSVRSVEEKTGISKSTVQRYFALFGVQPHRSKSFKLSNDPFFVEKMRDIVGLYLNPPEKALVLCVDEKSQIQALERTQPNLPMGLGYVEGVTHDYTRHGTTTLFAALDISKGEVITKCKKRHRHQEFLSFLKHIEESVPANLDVHLILDNYATHKHTKVRAWIAKRPRFHLHFTPTYASWLNQVERWFALITMRAIRRGSFRNVKELIRRIEQFVQTYNATACPFSWTATADSILEKLRRLTKVINGTPH